MSEPTHDLRERLTAMFGRAVLVAESAVETHGPYHSYHEALGVLLEEFEELKAEVFRKVHVHGYITNEALDVAAVAMRIAAWAFVNDCVSAVESIEPNDRIQAQSVSQYVSQSDPGDEQPEKKVLKVRVAYEPISGMWKWGDSAMPTRGLRISRDKAIADARTWAAYNGYDDVEVVD